MPLPDEVIAKLREYVTTEIAIGFDDQETILVTTMEVIGSHCDHYQIPCTDGELEQLIATAIAETLNQHHAVQSAWEYPTDCDRLDEAFEAFNEIGIVARQHFSCCQSCGVYEIRLEMEQTPHAVGYAFYHFQDTEAAVQGRGLYLSYGAASGRPADTVGVGRTIMKTLRLVGLPGRWSGRASQRIFVPLNWQRRRF